MRRLGGAQRRIYLLPLGMGVLAFVAVSSATGRGPLAAAAVVATAAVCLLALLPSNYLAVAAVGLIPLSAKLGYYNDNFSYFNLVTAQLLLIPAALLAVIQATQAGAETRLRPPPWPANVAAVVGILALLMSRSMPVAMSQLVTLWSGWLVMFIVINVPARVVRRILEVFTVSTIIGCVVALMAVAGRLGPLEPYFERLFKPNLAELPLSHPLSSLSSESILRADFNLLHPNGYALFLLMSIPLAVIAIGLSRKQTWIKSVLIAGCLSLATLTMALTYSRGGLLGALAMYSTAGLLLLRSPRLRAIIVTMTIVVLGAGLVVLTPASSNDTIAGRVASIGDYGADKTFQFRIDIVKASPSIVFAHPLGLGYGGFQGDNLPSQLADYRGWLNNTHNLFLQIAVEQSLLMLAAFLLLIGTALKAAGGMLGQGAGRLAVGSMIIAGLVGVMVDGLGEAGIPLDPILMMTVWLLLALPFSRLSAADSDD